ncbi:MAG: YgiQ family radical SAM protein [Candidatus Woesearchaeota archaeon]|jgi:uncharacterized radical SAM protein YgiQ
MTYDIIFILGEAYFDHPLSGPGLLKRLLEKQGFSVGVIDTPRTAKDIANLGKPRLFFAVSSGSIDSMLRNYTPLKKLRSEDPNKDDDIDDSFVPNRAVIVYCNWIRQHFKESILVIGGVEATLRRFTHYDYWDNKLRKPILVDSRADILLYGNSEKQIIEVANKLNDFYTNQKYLTKTNIIDARLTLQNISGTCIISKTVPQEFIIIPSHEEVSPTIATLDSKEKFCDLQNSFSNFKNLAEQVGDRYILQYSSPNYTSKDLDEYYELPFSREIPKHLKYLRGFQFSVVTHRGCIGECNFCSLTLTQGNKIISRSEKSILKEIENITKLPHFKGNIDDLGGPAANMYGMDCIKCEKSCLGCKTLKKDYVRMLSLLKKARAIEGVKKINIRSGILYDLCSEEYLQEVVTHHIAKTLRIAPEHINNNVLELMNKNHGNLKQFIDMFNKIINSAPELKDKELSFYFMTAHPGSSMIEAKELAEFIKHFKNAETAQIFTPTPMTNSTCMYYTGLDPKTKKPIYVPYTYSEKKEQKRILSR